MKCAIIRPAPLRGSLSPPPSKSLSHRAIICASLAKGKSRISPFSMSEDIAATIGVMRALGAEIEFGDNELLIDGTNTLSVKTGTLQCGESGSTLRFLIPVAAAAGGRFTFTGRGRLPQRPLGPYLDCLPKAGVSCATHGGLPLEIGGRLGPGTFSLPGNVSSQFVTGLLFALPLLEGDSVVRLTSPPESAGYIGLTVDTLRTFGVDIVETGDGYYIRGNQRYRPCDFQVEGDWSQAAFWLAAGVLSGPVACRGLKLSSLQGDRAIARLLLEFGGRIRFEGSDIQAERGSLSGIDIDASQIPDLVPVLAATACFAQGKTVIYNAARLRIKESDRLRAITLGLRALGAEIEEHSDGLVITGSILRGGQAEGFNDHRIVMSLSIAAAFAGGQSAIRGCECVNKSYPEFFDHFNCLGGCAHVVDMG